MTPSSIRTERLTLEPLRVDDAPEMVPVLGDASLYEFTGGDAPTPDALEGRYRNQVAGSGEADEIWCNWIVRTVHDRTPVGFVQATVRGTSGDVAWLIGVEHQRRGFAREAVAAMSGWLGDNGVDHLEAHIHPQHRASQLVAERVGLAPSGRIDDDGEQIWSNTVHRR